MRTGFFTAPLLFFAPKHTSMLFQLVLAFFVAACLLFVKIWIPDIGRSSPFLLFSASIILCGWFAGLASSIALTILSALLLTFIFVSPFGLLNSDTVSSVQSGLFIVECFFISFCVEYIKRIYAKYVQQEQFMKILLKVPLDEAIVILDEHNTIVGWNSGAQKLFGYKEEEIKGKPISLLCDKKNWFNQKANVLHVRVVTRYIFSSEESENIKIKIIQRIQEKSSLASVENFPVSPSFPANALSQAPQV